MAPQAIEIRDSRPEMAAGRETGGGAPLLAALSSRRGRGAEKPRNGAASRWNTSIRAGNWRPAEKTG